jgi:hypothetical protein
MRYEHITLDLSTRACDELRRLLEPVGDDLPELQNLRIELRARLQHTDQDPHAVLPDRAEKDWLDT